MVKTQYCLVRVRPKAPTYCFLLPKRKFEEFKTPVRCEMDPIPWTVHSGF